MAALLSLILDCFAEKKQQKTMLEAAKAMVDVRKHRSFCATQKTVV